MHTRRVSAPLTPRRVDVDEHAREQALRESGADVEFSKETLEAAAKHFREFFDELGEHLVEREDFLDQMQLALIAQQHVAIIGFPGTAKTTAATWILKRIVDDTTDEPSFYEKQCHAEMRESEIKGTQLPREIKYTVDDENGTREITEMEMARQVQQGIAPFRYALIDEGFDAPANVLRATLLSILLNRYILDGALTYPCKLRTAVLTSNKTLEQLRAMHGDELDALLDRFSYNYWCTDFELDPDNSQKRQAKHMEREADRVDGTNGNVLKVAPLKVSEMDVLHKAYGHVIVRAKGSAWISEALTKLFIAYREVLEGKSEDFGGDGGEETVVRKSKQLSPRTNNALFNVLASIAVQRYIKNPQTPLAIVPEDIKKTELFLMMRAQTVALIKDKGKLDTRNSQDQAALRRRLVEGEAFEEAYTQAITNNPDLQLLFAAATRNRPTNIDELEQALALGTNCVANPTGIAPTQVQRITDELTRRLAQYEAVSLKIWEAPDGSATYSGENLYARAVETYLKLLTLLATQGNVQNARRNFVVNAVPHVKKLESSFYKGAIATNVQAYMQATERTLMSYASETPRLVASEALGIARNTAADFKDILSAETIAQIRDAVRNACVSSIADGTYNASLASTNIASACREFEDAHRLIQDIQNEGIGGKVPVERLADAYGHILELLLSLLTDAKETLKETLSEADRDALLQTLDRALNTHELYKSFFLSPPSKDKLEEAPIAHYLEKRTLDRERQNPDAQVFYKIIAIDGGSNAVDVEWTLVKSADQSIENTSLRNEYTQYLHRDILRDEEKLLQLPAILCVVDKIISDIKKYFGKQWDDDVELLIKGELADYVRLTMREGRDMQFEVPVERSDRTLKKPLILPYSNLLYAIDDKTTEVWNSREHLLGFMLQKGLAVTEANIKAIVNLLSSNNGTYTVQIESLETSIEEIDLRDVMRVLHEDHIAEWNHLKTSIDIKRDEIGMQVAQKHLESKRSMLALLMQSTLVTTPDAIIAELTANLSTSSAAQPIQLQHITVPVLSDVATNEYIERRLSACFAGMQVRATSGLSEVLLDPKIGALAECAASFGLSRARFNEIIKPTIEAQLERWATDRLANVAAQQSGAPEEITTMTSDATEALKKKSDQLKREIGKSIIVFARGDFAALNAIGTAYGINQAKVAELGERVASGLALSAITALENGIDLLAQINISFADGDFDMTNLSTLNSKNEVDVTRAAGDIYRASKKSAKGLKTLLEAAGSYVSSEIVTALDQVLERNDVLWSLYLARQNDVVSGN